MDAYLDIAARVLRAERRPLSPRAILAAAYRSDIVPLHLHGKTQHKTLQARLSEEIVTSRDQSLFFRTAPGRFFLREFLADSSLPEQFRRPAPTQRRVRQLVRGPVLAVDRSALRGVTSENTPIRPETIYQLLANGSWSYDSPKKPDLQHVLLRSFVFVKRGQFVLSYRLGRYRDDRDTFMSKRSLGFSTMISHEANNLFNSKDLGIIECGVQAAKIDLDIPLVRAEYEARAALISFVWSKDGVETNDLLAVIVLHCPDWFEPLTRRLALNDLSWLDCTKPVNNLDDFDPWSKTILRSHLTVEPCVAGG